MRALKLGSSLRCSLGRLDLESTEMHTLNRRAEPRKKTLIHAFASDLGDKYDVKCVIRDVSRNGCRIVSSHIDDLPDTIKIVPEGFAKPVIGKIVWKNEKMAGIRFLDGEEGLETPVPQTEAPLDFFSRLQKFSIQSRRYSVLQPGPDGGDDDVVGRMVHVLRAPLTVVMGALDLLRAGALGPLPQRIKTVIDLAYANAGRLTALSNDVLDMRLIETGGMRFEFNTFKIARLAEEAIAISKTYAEKNGVAIGFDNQVGRGLVNVDPARIEQVLENLIANAVKFSPDGGEVVVSLSREADRIRVAVVDNGPGIPADMHQRIFEKFFRVDSPNARINERTGLGLSLCKAIVEAHGSSIHVTSEPGRGAAFHFDITEVPSPENGANGHA